MADSEIVEASKEEALTLTEDELDKLAFTFGKTMERMRSLVRSLSKKSIERGMLAAIEYPFKGKPVFRNKQEEELFTLTLNMNVVKNTLVDAAVKGIEKKKEETNGEEE